MAEDPSAPEEEPAEERWIREADEILAFLRIHDLIAAVDLDVWLFKGNASDQLSAYLARKQSVPCLDIHLGRSQKNC